MKISFAVLCSASYGLIVRLLFNILDLTGEIMSLSFLVLTPMLIGFLTIVLVPYAKIKTPSRAFFIPWLTTLLLLIVTIAFEIEGAICWVLIYPLFSIVAGLGGVIGYNVKERWINKRNNNNGLSISLLVLLPVCMAYFESDITSATKECKVSADIVINAPASKVWEALTHTGSIGQKEIPSYFTAIFGLPHHIKTVVDTLAIGNHRKVYFEKGLFFDETITRCIPGKLLTLAIKADPNKIPPTVMDEHIVIGGKHINVLEDAYTLEELTGDKCKLSLTSRFTISTPFNWYAGIWANAMIHDILQGEIEMVGGRSIK